MRQWSHAGFHRQHSTYMLDRVQTELYRGRAGAAWQVLADDRKALERSQMLRVQFHRIEAAYMRARCAALMAATGENRRRFLAIARGDARTIARENMPWSNPLASLLFATISHLEGDARAAHDGLVDAAVGFKRANMNLYLAVARRRLSELAGDDARELRRQADDWMAAQGIVNPARITRLIAPGFPDETSQ
jgi:eukaryotic-like serine/threonine-protein kinase